jgi:hypothetical protein
MWKITICFKEVEMKISIPPQGGYSSTHTQPFCLLSSFFVISRVLKESGIAVESTKVSHTHTPDVPPPHSLSLSLLSLSLCPDVCVFRGKREWVNMS